MCRMSCRVVCRLVPNPCTVVIEGAPSPTVSKPKHIFFIDADDTLHWTEDTKQPATLDTPWFRPYYRPRSADIEMTSYALLVYAHRADRQNGLPIARWLAQQRNSLGGYSSTQV